jgi:hypothetical protein
MDESPPDILVLDQKINPADLARLAAAFFEEIMDPAIRERVRELTFALIGKESRSREPACFTLARALGEVQSGSADPDDR